MAQMLVRYGWLLVAVTAASPLLDCSLLVKGVKGEDVFTGISSYRCGEMGYWSEFAPTLSYNSVDVYAASIRRCLEPNLRRSASDLYYPIRLKPPGRKHVREP